MNPLLRFMKKFDVANSGCMPWTASRDRQGYGYFRVNGKTVKAHRWIYERLRKPIPAGYLVCHTCDIPSCVNIDHLFLGTAADNNADKTRKGRQLKGEAIKQARLTESDVREIRRLLSKGLTQSAIASRYGVSQTQISCIKLGKTWSHV
jgi:hypothetical protein